jgi:hypothetical protein
MARWLRDGPPVKGIQHPGSGKVNSCAEPHAAHRRFTRAGAFRCLAKGVQSCSGLPRKLKRLAPFRLEASLPDKALEPHRWATG